MQRKENLTRQKRVEQVINSRTVQLTQYVVVITAFGLIVYDIYLYANKSTISEVMHANSVRGQYFVLTWLWGVLSGHLFLARDARAKTVPEGIAILILVLISTIIFSLGFFVPVPEKGESLNLEMHVMLLSIGTICGYLLWPQKFMTRN